VFCFSRTVENGEIVDDCEMHLKADLEAGETKYFKVEFNAE
jgi:hypothetical protein